MSVLSVASNVQLPVDKLNMILVQPAASLVTTDRHQLDPATAERQMTLLENVVDLAEKKHAHVIAFPEYALPGEQWRKILDTLDGLPSNSLFVAGLDAVTYSDYLELANGTQSFPTSPDVAAHQNEWVNCGLIVVKGQKGELEHFVQPKLCPAKAEQGQVGSMYDGQRVDVVRVGSFHVGLLICRDLIHRVPSHDAPLLLVDIADWIIAELRSRGLQLDFLFVIQDNPKPENELFLGAKAKLIESGQVRCVVVANHSPYGKTGLYVPKQRYQLSAAVAFCFGAGHPQGEALPALARSCRPQVFLLSHRPAIGITGQPNILPVQAIEEYDIVDGCIPGDGKLRPVYYWAFVDFDKGHPHKDEDPLPSADIKAELGMHYEQVRQLLADVENASAIEGMMGVLFAGSNVEREPLRWDDKHVKALGGMLRSLATIGFAGRPQLASGIPSITAQIQLNTDGHEPQVRNVAILTGGADRRIETCIQQYVSYVTASEHGLPAPVLTVVLDHKDTGRQFPVPVRILGLDRERLNEVRVELAPIDRAPLAGARITTALSDVDIETQDLPLIQCHSGRALEGYMTNLSDLGELRERILREVSP